MSSTQRSNDKKYLAFESRSHRHHSLLAKQQINMKHQFKFCYNCAAIHWFIQNYHPLCAV